MSKLSVVSHALYHIPPSGDTDMMLDSCCCDHRLLENKDYDAFSCTCPLGGDTQMRCGKVYRAQFCNGCHPIKNITIAFLTHFIFHVSCY